jgi:hypothetical protein
MSESSPVEFLSSNPWSILEKLVEHPHGVELLDSFRALYREIAETRQLNPANLRSTPIRPVDIGNPELVRQALTVVEYRGIINPPRFEKMKKHEIQTFIEKYSRT